MLKQAAPTIDTVGVNGETDKYAKTVKQATMVKW